MKLNELKRGMRITLRQKDVEVIDAITDGKVYLIDGAVIKPTDDLKNEIGAAFDIIRVEDLDNRGNYHEIYTREEPKFWVKPKGMFLGPGKILGRSIKSGYWETADGMCTDEYKIEFTKNELEKYGVDEKHFDLVPVITLLK